MRGWVGEMPTRNLAMALAAISIATRANGHPEAHPLVISPRDAPGSLLLVVGSLTDREGICEAAPPDVVHVKPTINDCTLRTAIALSNAHTPSTAVTILLRSGTFLLSAPLPEVTGTVQIIGSAIVTETAVGGLGREEGAGPGVHDAGYDAAAAAAGLAGQTSPIRTVLDGGGGMQLLRTAVGSTVHLATLRLEHGTARLGNGGCISSRGTLVLNNVAVRYCEAANGGAIYSDGELEVRHWQHEALHVCACAWVRAWVRGFACVRACVRVCVGARAQGLCVCLACVILWHHRCTTLCSSITLQCDVAARFTLHSPARRT